MPTHRAPSQLLVWAALITIYIVWGSTYLGIAVAIETIPPFLMVAARFILAGLLLVGAVALFGNGVRRPTLREIRDSAIVGVLLVAGGNGFVTLGQQTIPSGIAALMVALMPVWMAVLGRVVFGDRLPRLVTAGVVIGFVGVAILAWPSEISSPLEPIGLLALIIAPIAWASGSLFAARRASLPRSTLLTSGLQMIAGGLFVGVFSVASGELARFEPAAVSAESIVAFLFLTFVGSLLGYSTYAWLLSSAPVSLVSTYAYVNPVVAVVLGALVLGETITPQHLVAGAVIVLAVAIIITARSRMSAPRAAEAEPTPGAAPADRPPSPVSAAVARPSMPGLRPRIGPRPEPSPD
jgi:drug/metabolite transporter (DMT)-like permease